MEAAYRELVAQGWNPAIAREAILVNAGWSDSGLNPNGVIVPPPPELKKGPQNEAKNEP